MRYHTKTPLSSRSPNFPIDHSVQRSNPTCSLSLTSVSASGKELPSSDAMVVDPPQTTLIGVSASSKVPFPKRPHSLLRATTSRSQTAEGSSTSFAGQESDEGNSAQDFEHPRKRTRTSALATSTRIRLYRPIMPIAQVSADTAVPPLIVSPVGSFGIIPPLSRDSQLHANLSPSSTLSPITCDTQSEPKVSASPNAIPIFTGSAVDPSNPSPPRLRRRPLSSEMRFFLHLYRTLVYGLEVRYIDRPKVVVDQDSSSNCAAQGTGSTAGSCLVKAKSYFDFQDALLAQHLKVHLLAKGTDIHLLVVNVEGITPDGFQDMSAKPSGDPSAMEIDVERSSHTVSCTPPTNPVQQLHLIPSATNSLLSYQQLIATLLMRRHLHSTRLQGRSSSKLAAKRRTPSALAECISLE